MPSFSYSQTILIADPRILAIPVKENHEELIDLKNQNQIAYGPSPEIPNNNDYTKLRKSVYEKLILAQSYLPSGIKLCLYEGYRSLSLQEKLFSNRYNKIKKLHSNWSHEQIFIETTKIVSPVTNLDGSNNIPPHSTGGAIDIYLIDANGKYLDMGMHPADEVGDDDSISRTDSVNISSKAAKNREIMSQVLLKVGFVNYPTEYWHWSYGDRYWAFYKQESTAIYEAI